jgi:hypothetical protein
MASSGIGAGRIIQERRKIALQPQLDIECSLVAGDATAPGVEGLLVAGILIAGVDFILEGAVIVHGVASCFRAILRRELGACQAGRVVDGGGAAGVGCGQEKGRLFEGRPSPIS